MDEADSSWVRRTRFSQSVVRSSSSRGERFGAFNRGTAPRHDFGWRIPRRDPQTVTTKGADNSAGLPVPRAVRHSERKLKHTSSDSQLNRERRTTGDRSSSRQGASDWKGDALLNSDVPPVRLPTADESPPDATEEFSFHSEEQSSRLQRACSSPAPLYPLYSLDAAVSPVENDSRLQTASFQTMAKLPPKPKRRAKSPIPTRVVLSDVFKEAKAATKRFSSPQKQRKSRSLRSSPDDSPPFGFASLRTSSKLKITTSWRGTTWPIRNPGNGLLAKVSASKILERWTVDRSRLFIGHRFASGAYSRLFHGIYKEEPVAVKFIRLPDDAEDDELSARLEKQFTSELTILARLQHPNIIKLVGACNCPPVLCVITEFLSGGSLRAFLRKQECKTLPLEKVISISLDIARGLEYIHLQGVVHRDVKPENILFDGEFCAKVVDFGVACEEAYCSLIDDDPGTYRWMAPEIYKHKPYDRKVDVYSFGILLWELITGSLPYEDMTPVQAAFAVVHKNLRPVIPSSCPPPLRLLIEQCWSSQPGKRPEFREIVQILENLKTVLDRDGTLDKIPSSTRQAQECNDQNKKKLANWLQKLSYDQPDFSSGPPPPKLL